MIADNTIVNAEINSSAQIAYSKLNLTNTILDADINASAAIAWTKIAPSSTVSTTELGYLDGVTSAIQTQIDSKLNSSTAGTTYAPLASPALTGVPTAPTAAANTNTTQIATTAYVQTEIADLIASAPGALDTLDELAAALGDDANYASTITTALGTKAPLASPTFTGSVTIGEAITKTTSTTLTSASTTTIATFPGSPGLSAECMVVFSSESSGAQTTSKVLIVGSYDEGTVDITEYAIIERGGILEEPIQTTLSASFSGSNIVLRAAAVNYQAVNVKVISTHILSPLGAT
jgi:hypothetical protein